MLYALVRKPPRNADHNAPRRTITPEEARRSGFPPGTEVTATITTDQLMESGAMHFLDAKGRPALRPV